MPDRTDVYVLPEEDILEALKRDQMMRKAPRAAASIPLASPSPPQAAAQVLPIAADPTPAPRRAAVAPRREDRSSGPHPALASSLSLFVWGTGQIYAGQKQMGMFLLLAQALAAIGHWSLMQIWPGLLEIGGSLSITEWGLFRFFAIADLLLVGVFVFNVVQAYRGAAARGRDYAGTKWPVLSGAASALVPGWGQILNGESWKAGFFLLCLAGEIYAVLLLACTPIQRIMEEAQAGGLLAREPLLAWGAITLAAAVTWAVSAWDAVVVANMRRRRA